MQETACLNKTEAIDAEFGKRKAHSPKIAVPLNERAAYTLNEFSALFGKQTVWAYRLAYAGKIKVMKLGRMMVPRSEVERLQNSAEVLA